MVAEIHLKDILMLHLLFVDNVYYIIDVPEYVNNCWLFSFEMILIDSLLYHLVSIVVDIEVHF